MTVAASEVEDNGEEYKDSNLKPHRSAESIEKSRNAEIDNIKTLIKNTHLEASAGLGRIGASFYYSLT